jgi:SAM-dependent methyltransferase
MTEPKGNELIARYKQNYSISADADITEDMILAHWELEKSLAGRLLKSGSANRRETFEHCYSVLYGRLEWLNRLEGTSTKTPSSKLHRPWLDLIGRPPQSVYEIGSGRGELIGYLANCEFKCTATEITPLRGQDRASDSPNLSWATTDGVHLDRFAPSNSFDVVLSNHVIEHLHPDDLADHLLGASRILKTGGRYIIRTPHMYSGPWDISRVFGCDEPRGMHLKEYTYHELVKKIAEVRGFRSTYAVLRVPTRVNQAVGERIGPITSRAYLTYLSLLEKWIGLLPRQSLRQRATGLARGILFLNDIFLVARK